jgi:DNA invertase Pin-like site-specific DNA recombinase
MPRRVGYVRVSTAKGEQLAALANQRSRVEATGVDFILQDIQSGRESDRDGYQQLLELIATKAIDEVVIARVDRLGRDAADTDAAIAFAAKNSVTITALDGGTIESETPAGFVMSRIMTTMAEMESRMLSNRIRAGLNERRRKAMPIRGRAPWGYRVTADKRQFEPHPIEWPRVQAFLQLMRENNWRMSTTLNLWAQQGLGPIPINSCRSIRGWLLNPILRGGIGYRQLPNNLFEEIVWETHEPLLSHAEVEHFTQILESNRRMWGSNNHRMPRLLTSLCKCGHCGRTMSYAGGRNTPALLCQALACSQRYKSTRESVIALAIAEALAAKAEALALSIPSNETPEQANLRATIASLEALNDPDLADAIAAKRERLAQLHSAPVVPPEILAALRDPRLYEQASYEELTDLFHQFVAQVVVTTQAVERVDLRF